MEDPLLGCNKEFQCNQVDFRRADKNWIFYGQANRKRLPLALQSVFCEFFGVFIILDYDSMCSEIDFTPEKYFSSNHKNSQPLLTAAAALSQNGQVVV